MRCSCHDDEYIHTHPHPLHGHVQVYESHQRQAKHAEDKTKRDEAKVAKEENRRQEEIRTYKHIMKVRGGYACICWMAV